MADLGNNALGMNTYIPLLEASGRMQVEYSRNPKSYALNSYTRQIVAKQPRGTYIRLNPNDAIRLQAPAEWPYGTPSPRAGGNMIGWTPVEFNCARYAPDPVQLDKLSVDIANFDVQGIHTRALARKAMLNRINRAMAVFTVAGNYTHTDTATNLGGGFADQGTVANPLLLSLLTACFQRIFNATGGSVSPQEMGLLVNQNTALRLSRSRELREFVATSPASVDIVIGEERFNSARNYFLPQYYSHFRFDVEDAISTSSVPGATTVINQALPDNVAIAYIRQGKLEKSDAEQELSTFTQFVYEDMTAEALTSEWDRLINLRVADHFDVQVSAPQTGVYITNLFS